MDVMVVTLSVAGRCWRARPRSPRRACSSASRKMLLGLMSRCRICAVCVAGSGVCTHMCCRCVADVLQMCCRCVAGVLQVGCMVLQCDLTHLGLVCYRVGRMQVIEACQTLCQCNFQISLQHTATHCSTPQRTTTHCNTLKQTATQVSEACRHKQHDSTVSLQHSAVRYTLPTAHKAHLPARHAGRGGVAAT